jgi:hypothetical protein
MTGLRKPPMLKYQKLLSDDFTDAAIAAANLFKALAELARLTGGQRKGVKMVL